MTRPSKRAVMEALADVLVEPNWELSEYTVALADSRHVTGTIYYCRVDVDGNGDGAIGTLNTRGSSKWLARRRMIELCENFHGGPRL